MTNKLIGRISSKKEVQQVPQPSLLWTAKEASLKCLSDGTASFLLKDCLISNWKKEPSQEIYFFDCHSKKINKEANGVVRTINDLTVAYAENQ